MKLFVIIGRRHGANHDDYEVISGPEIPWGQQNTDFRVHKKNGAHPDFEFIGLCSLEFQSKAGLSKTDRTPADLESERLALAEKLKADEEAQIKALRSKQPAPVVPEPPTEPASASNPPEQAPASEKKKRK